MSTPRHLLGKRVLVTGGSRGLGRALCTVCAAHGADVAFSYTRDEDGARLTQDAVLQAGQRVRSYCTSVLDAPATDTMVRDVEQAWGGIDILINNAGISQNLPLALMEEEDWDRVMDINVKGTFLTSRAVLRGMIRRKAGVVLNIGSLAGVKMIDAPVHYCASKAAVAGFSEALAKEVGRHGIRVLCLAPGLLAEGVGQNLPEHRLADYLAHNALGRVGTLAEVAQAAAFLCSPLSSYTTGVTVLMDGGM